VQTQEAYPAGQVCLDYQLKINEVTFPTAAPPTDPLAPCFKTCLSSGDKSALAFAFFLARLNADPDLRNKIVVFDDPITSLDANRRSRTCQDIASLMPRTAQLIVMSHDAYFLREVWELTAAEDTKTLCIAREGRHDSRIAEWNIETETSGEYYQNYYRLEEYLEGRFTGDLRDVARCIRPLLEANLRLRFPGVFPKTGWLGTFLEMIRDAPPTSPLRSLQPCLSELSEINNYSKDFHHDRNPTGASTHPITDGELKPFVDQTILMIGSGFSRG
jgi:wobble nucleotide-excising tRNase